MIGIFDRDNDKILQAVNAQTSEFYSFGNKVYGFCIPIPEMRFRNNQTKISIEYLYSDACLIENLNFISPTTPTFCTAKFRYRGEDHAVSIEYLENNMAMVKYSGKAKAVTPGQACVLYLGEQCLGSGIIKEVYKNNEKLWYL